MVDKERQRKIVEGVAKSIESKRCQQLSIRFECSRVEYENRHEL